MRAPLLLLGLLLAGCDAASTSRAAGPSPTADPVPAEFRAACGHPGAEVHTALLHVVIQHADCDLSGVVIVNQGRGVTVPDVGSDVGGTGSGAGVTVSRDAKTLAVTFDASAEVGNV